ncbi:hypothetical protein ATCC53582_00992 [Novacetimonas hansenii]|nr:hypothetical protein ATCC53582_00992 [Novacetimonas hansenii]
MISHFIPFERSQPYLLPPDLKSWLPADAMAHVIVDAGSDEWVSAKTKKT